MFCGGFEGLDGIHRCSDVAVIEAFRNEWIDKNGIYLSLFFFGLSFVYMRFLSQLINT